MTELADVIAERELEARHRVTGEVRRVIVRLGRPRIDERPGGDWACSIEFAGLGDDEIEEAYGVDGVQALRLAMQLASIRLASEAASFELTWLGEQDLGMGPIELPEP